MPLIPQQTAAQAANAQNPTPVTYNIPTAGLFRGQGDNVGSQIYKANADGSISTYSLGSLLDTSKYANNGGALYPDAQKVLQTKYGIDINSLPTYNLGDILQKNGGRNSVGNFSELAQSQTPASSTSQTFNTAPNPTASPQTIAASTAAQTQQLAGDQGQNVTQTTTPEGVAAVQKTPLGTPAAQTQNPPGVSTQTPSTAGAAAGAGTTTVAPPTSALQTGNTGPAVKQLQDWLVSQGYMTQDQVNTGYGTYGPQTTAAVAALQQKLGVDNSSGPGDFGPKTLAAVQAMASGQSSTGMSSSGITSAPTAAADTSQTSQDGTATTQTPDPYAGLDPVAKQVAMYTEAYNSLGLNTIKQQFDDYTQQQSDLTNKMNDEIANTTNNPWLSQGVVDKTVQRIKDKYATQLDTLTNLLTLTDSLYKQGQAQVETMVSNANADIKAANDLAQKQIDAANALAKDNSVHSELVNGVPHDLLINNETGKTMADLGPSASTASSGFSLSAGQTRFDANGNPIASVAAKPTAGTGGGSGTSDPITQSWVDAVLSGNSTMASVPAAYKNSVALAMSNAPATSYSPLASSRFATASNRIVSNFVNLPQFQLTANGLPYLQRIDAALKTPGSVSDQDLLDSLTKLNTAGNAISDAQVKIITDGRSLSDWASVLGNKVLNGGVLSTSQRSQIQSIAQSIYANYAKGYQPVYDQATAQLKAAGIPQAFWTIPDLNNLSGQSGVTSSASGVSGSGGDTASLAAQYGI